VSSGPLFDIIAIVAVLLLTIPACAYLVVRDKLLKTERAFRNYVDEKKPDVIVVHPGRKMRIEDWGSVIGIPNPPKPSDLPSPFSAEQEADMAKASNPACLYAKHEENPGANRPGALPEPPLYATSKVDRIELVPIKNASSEIDRVSKLCGCTHVKKKRAFHEYLEACGLEIPELKETK
jgi:hypothetical protein